MKLLYHPLTAESNVSPFDEAIMEVATGQPIQIISPYLGLSYLRRLTNCCKDWRLVSDIEEWLSAAKNERPQAFEFIKAHRDKIHHYENLHAKAVVGPHKAYLGSANLTSSGIKLRTEIGVQLDEPDAVRELNTWADGLWDVTQSPGSEELEAFFQQMMAQSRIEEFSIEKKPRLTGVGLRVRAKLSETTKVAVALAIEQPEVAQESVQNVMGLFAKEGLSLKDVLALLSDGSSKSRRRILDDVYRLCTNLKRSVYKLDNEQKLVWDGRRMQQATPSLVEEALTPYDKFLAEVINRLDIEHPKYLADLSKVASASAVPKHYAKSLLTELTHAGLLVAKNGRYVLNDEVDWPPSKKYYQFKRAGIAWESAMERFRRVARQEAVAVLPSIVPEDPKAPADSLPQPLVAIPEAVPALSSESGEPPTSRIQNKVASPDVKTRVVLDVKGLDVLCSTVIKLAIEGNGFLAYATEYLLFQAIEQRCEIPQIFYGLITGNKNIPSSIESPFRLKRVLKSNGWIISRSQIFKKNLAKLPATQEALDSYLKLIGAAPTDASDQGIRKIVPPPPSKAKVSIISQLSNNNKKVSNDTIFLEMARLLEQSKGNLSFKESSVLFNYLAVKLSTSISHVASTLTDKTASGHYGPIPLFSVRDEDGKILVDIKPDPRSKIWYSKTVNYLNKISSVDGYLASQLRNKLFEEKIIQKLSKQTPVKNFPSKSRLDDIQFALLSLASKSGSLPLVEVNDLCQLLIAYLPNLTKDELKFLTRGFENQAIAPPIFLKKGKVLIRDKHDSLANYPFTATLLSQCTLQTYRQL